MKHQVFFQVLFWINIFIAGCTGGGPYIYTLRTGAPAQPSALLAMEQHAAQDSNDMVRVRVTVTELDDQQPMSNTVVLFTKSAERTMLGGVTNEAGLLEKRLRPGRYDIEVRFTGKQTLMLEKTAFVAGFLYILSIGMGDNSTEQTHIVKSKRPLTEEELQQQAERYRSKQ